MRRVIISRRAAQDMLRAERWLLDAGATKAAEELGSLLITGIDSLTELAERGHPVEGGGREINVKHGRSRYVLTYRVIGECVILTAVEHHLTRRVRPEPPAGRSSRR